MFGEITEAILLLALGLGYIVLYLANREEKALRTIGYLIGVFIISLSVILILSALTLKARFCRQMGGMDRMMPHHKMMMKGQVPVPETPIQK